jgi:hypothetical protein
MSYAAPGGAQRILTMKERLHVLQHSLGLNQYGQGAGHRNYFVTSEGATDWPVCVAAVADGLMTQTKGNEITGGGDVFRVTPAGMVWVQEHSPKAPTLTRAQRVYLAYLRADCSLTFGEWLKAGRAVGAA